jgi:ion channel-forming bestrophin family protein
MPAALLNLTNEDTDRPHRGKTSLALFFRAGSITTSLMVPYNPKKWDRILFSVHGTVLPRTLKRVAAYGGLTAAVWAWNVYGMRLPAIDPLGHSLLGVALGLLIVFRTNTSYDRYWEGRKLWGQMVTAARNLIRGAASAGVDVTELVRLAAAYTYTLKQHLRGSRDFSEIKPLVSESAYANVAAASNPPSVMAFYLSAWIQERLARKEIDTALSRGLESCVGTMVENEGGCERIGKTPIPFAYAVHLKQMLTVYLLTLPFVLVPKMDAIAILTVAGITFGLVGIEEAGVEIEDPFGTNPNDLPMEEFCDTITRDIGELARLSEREAKAA